jgi:3-hydroxymyristoyl/3-hydroxydecanoyl-(acyl carrier protein) dehydratase
MIDRILKDQNHAAKAVCVQGRNGVSSVLQTLAMLNSHGFRLDLSPLYSQQSSTLRKEDKGDSISVRTGHEAISISLPSIDRIEPSQSATQTLIDLPHEVAEIIPHPSVNAESFSDPEVIEQMLITESVRARTHETFLRVSNGISRTLSDALSLQLTLLQNGGPGKVYPSLSNSINTQLQDRSTKLFMDRKQCMEFAIGSIARVLGEKFADIDRHPTRVRLPDEPLMLVDRILEVEGEPDSMSSGRVVTEHDIHSNAWYLDGGRIPTCIAVESGQADLFLSGYLGIDHVTRGLAVYRLLDAEITFHGPLPSPEHTIQYDIRIEHFFRQGKTHLFRFNFDGTVNGEKLLTMRNGCAGFFSQAELDAGRGIVQTALERREDKGRVSEDWQVPVPMIQESYDDAQLNALRKGELQACFGPRFQNLPLTDPVGLPGERMTLVHRILDLIPQGGRFGLGKIMGEADINPDDWFLSCHFIDDQVMPGTLMYECCLHTLRIYLMRMGWIAEKNEVVYEPVPGVASKLKCRGQVTASTQSVQYEIILKELGYKEDGTPYVIADALMYADKHPIVQMDNMSLQLSGLTRSRIMEIWQSSNLQGTSPNRQGILFDYESILAFAIGKPSEAFGKRYLPFDTDRVIARLPGPPYQFLDRIVSIKNCEQWQLKAGGVIEAQYDVPTDAWYFIENRQRSMPYSVLLEVALQPCGWLAAYLGSALTSETDLSFRNLGGNAVQFIPVTANIGTLSSRVEITRVSISGGMIIQNFKFQVTCNEGTVFQGDTYFGFFSKQALSNQVGIRDALLYIPTAEEENRARNFDYPDKPPYPAKKMRMVDKISFFDPMGGPCGLGYIRGSARVDPDAWFFKAHFYQDPVWPGSLGLESFIQLLKVAAIEKWQLPLSQDSVEFDTMVPELSHQWLYRGQIIPENSEVSIEAVIKDVDNENMLLKADGHLSVDGRIIYQMTDFTLRIKDV